MTESIQTHRYAGVVMLVALLLILWDGPTWTLDFPGPAPGEANGRIDGTSLVLENQVLSFARETSGGQLRPSSVTDKLSGNSLDLTGTETFQIVLL